MDRRYPKKHNVVEKMKIGNGFLSNSMRTPQKILFSIIVLTVFSGCASNEQPKNVGDNTSEPEKFAVYLVDSRETIFSEDDIALYDASTQTFTFTPEGAKKMKRYQPSLQIDTGLYKKAFVVKLGSEEIYKGKFWTGLSSLSESGIVMLDVAMVGPDYNTLTVSGGYPAAEFEEDNGKSINDPRLIEHFKKITKLK